MAQTIGQNKSTALTTFHALAGFNVTSVFAGKGQWTAWSAWNVFYDASNALCTLARTPSKQIVLDVLPTHQRLLLIVYDCGSTDSSDNGVHQSLFTQKNREIENIPLTQDALIQH